jgi:hypothetical protein
MKHKRGTKTIKRGRDATRPAHDVADRDEPQTAFRRRFVSHFLAWKVCGTAACLRAKRCTGDANRCWSLWWEYAPEDFKFELRQALLAMKNGATAKQATEIGKEKLAAWREQEAKLAAEDEARAAARAAPPVAPKPTAPQPRIRVL